MEFKVNSVPFSEEFRICPTCGYKDGFHSMFKREGEVTKWLFICPSCHNIFDVGFTV